MLTIDGAMGEGGGQVLRTSLALSLVTGQSLRMTGIRARRDRPGLMRQHLAAVHAAQQIGEAEVTDDRIGSRNLTFIPRALRAGDYRFAIGTAGSTTLVLQTVLPALLLAPGPSTVLLEGGTHNPNAPPFDFLQKAFLPLLERMGPRVSAVLERYGFYPAGGGRVRVTVAPARLAPLDLRERGSVRACRARSVVARLPRGIAQRELAAIGQRLGWEADRLQAEEVSDVSGPGNVLTVEIESAHVTEVFTGFGERGVPAERVAEGVANEASHYLAAGVPVGAHLADQLLVPLALAGAGRFKTLAPSLHTRTNIEVIQRFVPVAFEWGREQPDVWEIHVRPR